MPGFKNVSKKPFDTAVDQNAVATKRRKALPLNALAIFEEIREEDRAARGLRLARDQDIEKIRGQLSEITAGAAHYDRQIRHGAQEDEADAKRRADMDADAAACHAEIARLQNTKQLRRVSPDQIDEWLMSQPHKFRQRIVEPKIHKGQTAAAALKQNLEARDFFLAEKKSAINAWLPLADARDQAMADLNTLVAAGAPDVVRCFRLLEEVGGRRRQGGVEWPSTSVGSTNGRISIGDGNALVAWLFKDQLVKRLDDLLKAQEKPDALSPDERVLKTAEIDAEILKLEYEESELTRMAKLEGAKVFFRGDLSIPALLQIERDDAPINNEMEFG